MATQDLEGEAKEPLRTRSGRVLTEADIEEFVAEAERGYDICAEPYVTFDPGDSASGIPKPHCADPACTKLHPVVRKGRADQMPPR